MIAKNGPRFRGGVLLVALLASAQLSAQTRITAPENKYSPADDVKLGREAAEQVEQQLPILRNERITSYVAGIGRRLVQEIPPDLQHPEFQYTFDVVNVKEINAFALPGGPMYVNRGMIEAAKTEGEIAGVMAHELSHVALRHGTAQQTKATPYALGQIAGAVIGAIVGGTAGNIISQGTQFGLGTAFLRFSREFEKQADLLGAQIMARAGYDPRDMANVFRTIEEESGPGGPQWLSDHPNPGNRYEYINEEAEALEVHNAVRDTRAFQQVQAALAGMSPAPSTEEATKNGAGRADTSPSSSPTPARVESPSSTFTTYNEGDVFRVSVPSNWRELGGNNTVTFAPEGGYGAQGRQSVFTHGLQIGVARNESHALPEATDELVSALRESNPRLSRPSGYSRGSIDGQSALHAVLSNVSDATGQQERIAVFTTQLPDGNLFYVLGVAPRSDFDEYQQVFRQVVSSIQFAR